MSSENKLQFNSSDVAPVEGKGRAVAESSVYGATIGLGQLQAVMQRQVFLYNTHRCKPSEFISQSDRSADKTTHLLADFH